MRTFNFSVSLMNPCDANLIATVHHLLCFLCSTTVLLHACIEFLDLDNFFWLAGAHVAYLLAGASLGVLGMSGLTGSGGGGGPPATAFKSPSTDGKRRSTRFKDEDEYVEVTLDVRGGGDGVAVRSVKGVGVPADAQDAALLERHAPGPGGLSSKLRALKRIASGNSRGSSNTTSGGSKRGGAVPLSALLRGDRPATARLDRSVVTGAASALRGLQFLNQAAVTEGWPEVEKRFHRLAVDGFLLRSRFGQCIGE
jgi:respiratory burst oxidase